VAKGGGVPPPRIRVRFGRKDNGKYNPRRKKAVNFPTFSSEKMKEAPLVKEEKVEALGGGCTPSEGGGRSAPREWTMNFSWTKRGEERGRLRGGDEGHSAAGGEDFLLL